MTEKYASTQKIPKLSDGNLWSNLWVCYWMTSSWNGSGIVLFEEFLIKQKNLFTFISIENRKLNTTPCWPRQASITTTATTLNWEQLAVNTSECAPSQSQTLVILISSERCQKPKPEIKWNCIISKFYNEFFGLKYNFKRNSYIF